MKIFLFAFAVIAAVAADVSNLPGSEYLPPQQGDASVAAPSNEYIPPAPQGNAAPVAPEPAHQLADDGYRYKTHRRVVYRRNRRDVSNLPQSEYLPPPQQDAAPAQAPSSEYLPPAQQDAPAHELANDGYRYKTHRRVVYRRNRRDVSQLPQNEYLPPGQEAPIQDVSNAVADDAAPSHELADDGYRYKTNRRVVYRRNRRDVSHLPQSEYLPPPQQDAAPAQAPSSEYLPPAQQDAPAHELASDGYRYKTQRRVVYRRNRRDVSQLPSSEYLPPSQDATPVIDAPVQGAGSEAAPAHELADDGYRYKTQRRVVYRRNRRDVSDLPSSEYLPPSQDSSSVADSSAQTDLGDDGYRYKTHRRVVYRRNRRDVSHLPSSEYLPPQQDASAPSSEYLPPVQQGEPAPAHDLSADGYRYKTHRRVVFRRH